MTNEIVPVPIEEYEAMKRDAARYQLIRAGDLFRGPRAIVFDMALGQWTGSDGEGLDAAVDAAIDASRMQAGFGEALALTEQAASDPDPEAAK